MNDAMSTDPIRDIICNVAPELLPDGDGVATTADHGAFESTYSEYESPDAARTAAVKKVLRGIDTERVAVDADKVMKYLQRGAFNPDTLDSEATEAVQMFSLRRNRSSLNPRGAGALPDRGTCPRDPIGRLL